MPTPSIRHSLIPLLSSLLLGACTNLSQPHCTNNQQPAIHDSLYFGTAKPDKHTITPEEWAHFLADTVTPQFPQGFTITQASGQWRNQDQSLSQEQTWKLELIHPDDIHSQQAIAHIIHLYKTRFQQEAVLRSSNRVCVSF